MYDSLLWINEPARRRHGQALGRLNGRGKDIQIYVSKVFKYRSKRCWMNASDLMDIKQSRLSSEKAACRCVDAWNAGWASGAKQTKSR